jgi:hypothetical protein
MFLVNFDICLVPGRFLQFGCLVLRRRWERMLDVGVGHQQHRLVDGAGFGVHSTSSRTNYHYFFDHIHNHDYFFNHQYEYNDNHNNIATNDNDFIYNNPSSRNDHNHRASSVKHNHINDKYHDNDDHNCCTSSDHNASTLHSSSNHDD